MKNIAILPILLLALAACAHMGARTVPVVLPDNSPGWVIDCSAHPISACFEAAGHTCDNGYAIHERTIEAHVESMIPTESLQPPDASMIMPGWEVHTEPREKYMIISCKD